MAKAGGLRRPTAQKRFDSGAIGRNTWLTKNNLISRILPHLKVVEARHQHH